MTEESNHPAPPRPEAEERVLKKAAIYLNLHIPAEGNLAVMPQNEGLEEEKGGL